MTRTLKSRTTKRVTKLTEEFLLKFLEILCNNGGIICDACADLNISRTAIYVKKRDDSEFAKAFDEAVDRGIDVIEDEAKIRALDGTEEPIYYQGQIVGHVHKKSDYCLGLVLKAHRGKYRDKHEISGPGGRPLTAGVKIVLPDNKRGRDKKK